MNAITPAKGSSSLKAIEQARQRLADARGFADVLEVADQAKAAQAYLQRKTAATSVYAEAWALEQDASRKLGELTLALPKAKPGPKKTEIVSDPETQPTPEPRSKREVIRELGVSPKRIHHCEQAAKLDPSEYEARRNAIKADIVEGSQPRNILATTSSTKHDGNEYSTPALYIEAARKVFGEPIDLDPASNTYAANVVGAARFFTKADNGLDKDWSARNCWLNPPYGKGLIGQFTDKFLAELAAQRFPKAIVLTNCDPSTAWFQALLAACDCFCLPAKRIAFEIRNEPVDGNFFAQTFFYFGRDTYAFQEHFRDIGQVCIRLMEPGA